MKMNTKEMFRLILKLTIIYFGLHLFKVCFSTDEFLNEQFLLNTLGISVSIVIYYIFFEKLLEKKILKD